jgi:activator of HSP90 ATPase
MKDLKLYFKLKASPADVYNALTNRIMIEIWSGEKAEFVTEPNTEFSWFDGAITGRNLAFEMDKKIEQLWYFEDQEVKVVIKIHPDKKFSSLEVQMLQLPDDAYENMKEGWQTDIFESLAELFND